MKMVNFNKVTNFNNKQNNENNFRILDLISETKEHEKRLNLMKSLVSIINEIMKIIYFRISDKIKNQRERSFSMCRIEMWSYASHGALCGVTTSHSTCCGCCVRDYHICFRLFALSSSSVPTLCLKDPRSGVDTIQPDLLLTVR